MPLIPATHEAEAGGSPEPSQVEAAVSQDHVTTLQPGKQSKTLSQKQTDKNSGAGHGGSCL